MGTKRDKSCEECDGNGFVWDFLGGCGDPDCCGGPWKVRCHSCDNDWEPGDEAFGDADYRRQPNEG